MKSEIRIDFEHCQLVMDRSFEKKAMNPASQEYEQLQKVRMDYPAFTVVRRTIKKNPQKETYAGLTYLYMENYIMGHESADRVESVLGEYRELRLISQCHGKGRRYPAIKKWFLQKYPEIAEFGIEKKTEEREDNFSQFDKFIPAIEQRDDPNYDDAA